MFRPCGERQTHSISPTPNANDVQMQPPLPKVGPVTQTAPRQVCKAASRIMCPGSLCTLAGRKTSAKSSNRKVPECQGVISSRKEGIDGDSALHLFPPAAPDAALTNGRRTGLERPLIVPMSRPLSWWRRHAQEPSVQNARLQVEEDTANAADDPWLAEALHALRQPLNRQLRPRMARSTRAVFKACLTGVKQGTLHVPRAQNLKSLSLPLSSKTQIVQVDLEARNTNQSTDQQPIFSSTGCLHVKKNPKTKKADQKGTYI